VGHVAASALQRHVVDVGRVHKLEISVSRRVLLVFSAFLPVFLVVRLKSDSTLFIDFNPL